MLDRVRGEREKVRGDGVLGERKKLICLLGDKFLGERRRWMIRLLGEMNKCLISFLGLGRVGRERRIERLISTLCHDVAGPGLGHGNAVDVCSHGDGETARESGKKER